MAGLADVDGFKICVQVCLWPDFRSLAIGNLILQNPLKFRGMTAIPTVCMDEICSSWLDFIHNDWKRGFFYVFPHLNFTRSRTWGIGLVFSSCSDSVLLKELISRGLSRTREIWY